TRTASSTPVAACSPPRSVSLPVIPAAVAPATPTSANSPIVASPKEYGGRVSRNAIDVQKTEKVAKPENPNAERSRRTGSVRTSSTAGRAALSQQIPDAGAGRGEPVSRPAGMVTAVTAGDPAVGDQLSEQLDAELTCQVAVTR